MSILNNQVRKTLTASSGSASDTFSTHGLCLQVLVKPTTSTTTYDFSLTDAGSLVVYQVTDEAGTLNDFITLPVDGNYTAAIDNASVDEDFSVLVVVRNS